MMPLPTLRIGQGFDLHRLAPGIPLKLAGLTIPFDKGSVGHSDGDVVLHALIDALLGATGYGDIGELFPDSDPAFKGALGPDLLAQALALIKSLYPDLQILNIDVTIFLEAPKLRPHKEAMREALASLLGIGSHQVSVKAKTAEQFAPVGTSEALAASVVCLLDLGAHKS
ncbi:MAG: 2-C-methyl-D-erythritol 2,4-cyclodiphosphate synthase [Vampirovibrionales bacterium]|nr:2-C-methyl-D-erythritol 2,4-cyclodiphosphate synthase [Vampirovibrionales bacterium]